MATSAFKSTTRRAPIATPSPSADDDSPASSSSSKLHRRSRSLSRFSRPIPEEIEPGVLPTPRRKFVNTVRGSGFPEISLDDLAIEFFSGKENSEDESGSSRNGGPVRVKSEISPVTTSSSSSQRRSRSVSRHHNGANSGVTEGASATASSSQRRGRSVSRRNDGHGTALKGTGTDKVVPNGDLRRRRSVSVARYQISDSESDIDHTRSSANQPTSRNINNGNTRVASFQRPTASSHRRLRSMSQTPQLRSHDGYSSQSSALTDDDSRDARHGRKEIEKTIRAVYAQKKIDHPTGDDVNHGLYEAMRKELRSAVNEIMIELEQTMERKPSASSVHDRLHSNKSDGQMVSTTRKNFPTKLKQPEKRKQDLSAERMLEGQQGKDGYKIVREVLPEPKNTANAQRVSHPRKRSNDRSRVSKRLNEEAEKYFEDFISNIEDTDFSSFDGERSDTSSTLAGTTKQRDGGQNGSPAGCNSLPVEMEGINLPWLKWDGNDGGSPTNQKTMQPPMTPKTKLWDPSQALELIQDEGSGSSHGSWNPENDSRNSSKKRDMEKYMEIERSEKVLFDNWRERSMIRSGGLLLCSSSNIVNFHF